MMNPLVERRLSAPATTDDPPPGGEGLTASTYANERCSREPGYGP
jgi:hypothetical protein